MSIDILGLVLRKYNENHVPSGEHGGEFTNASGGEASGEGDHANQVMDQATQEWVDVATPFDMRTKGTIVVDKDAPYAVLIKAQVDRAELPQAHLANLKVELVTELKGEAGRTLDRDLLGVYRPDTSTIKVNVNDFSARQTETILHEIGHHVHGDRLTSEAAYRWAEYSKGGETARISSYARTNAGEHFAEAYRAYARGGRFRENLKSLEPKGYRFMKDIWKDRTSFRSRSGYTALDEKSERYTYNPEED